MTAADDTPFRICIRVPPAGPLPETVACVRNAERAGLDMAWIPDSPLNYRELWSVLGACAVSCDRIGLGSAVTNLSSRHLTVTAAGAATIAQASGGRFTLGIGAGDSAVGYDGLKFATVSQLERGIRGIRRLLEGGSMQYESYEAKIRYAHIVPPILLAASGPRAMTLGGMLADGVIVTMGDLEWKIARVHAGAEQADRPAPLIYVIAQCDIGDPGPEIIRTMKHYCALIARREGASAFEKAGFGFGDEFHRVQAGAESDIAHVADVAQAAAALDRLIPDEAALWFMQDRTLVGAEADVIARMRSLARLGIAGVYLSALESSQLPELLIERLQPICSAMSGRK